MALYKRTLLAAPGRTISQAICYKLFLRVHPLPLMLQVILCSVTCPKNSSVCVGQMDRSLVEILISSNIEELFVLCAVHGSIRLQNHISKKFTFPLATFHSSQVSAPYKKMEKISTLYIIKVEFLKNTVTFNK